LEKKLDGFRSHISTRISDSEIFYSSEELSSEAKDYESSVIKPDTDLFGFLTFGLALI